MTAINIYALQNAGVVAAKQINCTCSSYAEASAADGRLFSFFALLKKN